MRLAITPDHKEYFKKNQYIEFEGLLSPAQVAALKKNAEETLSSRLKLPTAKLKEKPAAELFQAGYDLWRNNETIKKTVQKKDFALLASELFEILPIRLAFDEYIHTTQGSPFQEAWSLQETSCLSPLAGALILPLEDLMKPISSFPIPINSGHGLFISPTLPIPWPELFANAELRVLIIGFATKQTAFCADTRDPHAVHLKKLGYVFNDTLNEALHPILIRK